MKLSVVIPAYNEEVLLPSTLKKTYTWLNEHINHDFEILVVNDGSSDDTCGVVQQLMPEMPELSLLEQTNNQGKGSAVRRGMLEAKGDIHLFMDADNSTHIREIEKAFTILKMTPQCDVIIASRQHPDSNIIQHQSWLREHIGVCFNLLVRLATGLDIPDTQCGFKAFTAKASQQIFSKQKINGFGFDAEVLFLADRMGYQVSEIPIAWMNEANSKVRMFIDPFKMFIDILRLRRLHR